MSYLGIREVARLLGYRRQSLLYRIREGYLPAEKNDAGHWIIPMSAARDLIRRPRYARQPAA